MRELFDADHAAFAESFRVFVERETREPDALRRAGKAGLLGMQVPECHGGGGVDDPRFCAVAIEEFVRAGPDRLGALLRQPRRRRSGADHRACEPGTAR